MAGILLVLRIYRLDYGLSHVINHFIGHSGIYAYPEGIAHYSIGIIKSADYSVSLARSAHLVKAGVLGEVARKQHSRLNAVGLDVRNDFFTVNSLFAGDKEAEPRGVGVCASLGQNELVRNGSKSRLKSREVMTATLYEGREFLKLSAANRSLHIRCLQIVAEM